MYMDFDISTFLRHAAAHEEQLLRRQAYPHNQGNREELAHIAGELEALRAMRDLANRCSLQKA